MLQFPPGLNVIPINIIRHGLNFTGHPSNHCFIDFTVRRLKALRIFQLADEFLCCKQNTLAVFVKVWETYDTAKHCL